MFKTSISNNSELASNNLEDLSAHSRVIWSYDNYGDGLVMSTSFGIQSAVLLHLTTLKIPQIPVVFIDTGYLFKETYDFANELCDRLKLNLKIYKPLISKQELESKYGNLWEKGITGLEKYNRMCKVEPMNRAIKELNAKAWISGLRRDQSKSRKGLSVIEKQNKVLKIYPIIDWDDQTIYRYLSENNLPYHPLWEKGYVSVGDWHSSSPLKSNMSAEDTRFNGLTRECGLHISTNVPNYQI